MFNLVKSARCVLMAHNCVSMCTNTGQQLEVCAQCTCAVLEPRTRIVNVGFCTVQCALLSMYIMVMEVVCTDLLASLSYLGLYHILLLSADKPSLKDQKTVLPQRSRTKELLFTISVGSYIYGSEHQTGQLKILNSKSQFFYFLLIVRKEASSGGCV